MSTYKNRSRNLSIVIVCAGLVAGFVDIAGAQSGRGRGGFGRGVGGPPELAELTRESIQEELQLTEEQKASIQELSAGLVAGAVEMFELSSRIRRADSDEERVAAEAELTAFRESRDAGVRSELEQILDEAQLARLDQLVLHRAGPAAMARADVAETLGLSENQQIAIADMAEQRRDALRGAFRMTREEREQVEREWDTSILATLEEEQLVAWTEMLGDPPPAEEEQPFPVAGVPDASGDAAASRETPASTDDGVVASFEATDGDPEKMSFNFQDAPWEDVLREFAERADLKLDVIDLPTGSFTYSRRDSHTPTQALDILNGYLLQRGYILIQRDDFLVSWNVDNPIPPNLIPNVSASELYDRGLTQLMRMVFSVQVEDTAKLAEQVNEMLGPQGKAIGIDAAQAITVTDIGANLRSVHEMLQALSALKPDDAVSFRAYTLENIPASEAEDTLQALLGMEFEVQNVSRAAEESSGRGSSRDERGGWGNWGRRDNDNNNDNDRNNNGTTTGTSDLLAKTQITVNARTNQLLVAATQAAHTIITDALVHIDVAGDSRFFGNVDGEPYLHVYRLTDADATEVTKTLSVLMPHVVVNEDGRNELIHIMATAEEHRQVEQWIRQLDGLGAGSTVAVIPLASMDPLAAASTLNSMFISDSDPPVIEPNLVGRQLLVRGRGDQVDQIKMLLLGLGEDGTGQRIGLARGPIRRAPLSGRDAQLLLELIQPSFESTQGSHLQVLPPRERTPIYDIRLPDAWTRPDPTDDSEAVEPDEAPLDAETSLNSGVAGASRASLVAFFDDRPEPETEPDPSAQGEAVADESQSEGTAPVDVPLSPDASVVPEGSEAPGDVIIRVEGDELIYFSTDEEALDAFDYLLEEAMAYVQPQVKWKVYPLQTADAVETASMLELLIDGTTVSQKSSTSTDLLGSLRGLGNTVLDATGLDSSLASTATLQIIPEPNLNSLFVLGPASKIDELEQFLEILDTPEWFESNRDRFPRMIPVKHADISEVHQIVSDVFEDYLEAGQQNNGGDRNGRGGGGNPFAALLGGNGGQQGGPSETLLTLGVDEQTSHLIVSADEALYQQIKQLVESIDTAALEARRTVTVVNLQNTNSTVLQNTLSSLMPRVQVSTSGTRPRTSESSSRSDGGDNNRGGGDGGGPDQDQVRRFFEQRMRERMQQQGGDNNRGDRPSFGGFGGRTSSDGGRPAFGGFGGGRGPGGFGGFGGRDRGDRGR